MNLDDILNEKIKKVHGKWALVSKSDPDKVLQYYHGKDHPSKEWEKKVERRVHAFSEAESLDKTIDRMRNLDIDDIEHLKRYSNPQLKDWLKRLTAANKNNIGSALNTLDTMGPIAKPFAKSFVQKQFPGIDDTEFDQAWKFWQETDPATRSAVTKGDLTTLDPRDEHGFVKEANNDIVANSINEYNTDGIDPGNDELFVPMGLLNRFEDNGWYAFDGGRDQAVLAKRNIPYVLKIVGQGSHNRIDAVRQYVDFFRRNQHNPHFPKVGSDKTLTWEGKKYYAYAQEKLIDLPGDAVMDYLEDTMQSFGHSGKQPNFDKIPQGLSAKQVKGLMNAISELLASGIGNNRAFDLGNVLNIMKRKNGQLVIVDPFSSHDRLDPSEEYVSETDDYDAWLEKAKKRAEKQAAKKRAELQQVMKGIETDPEKLALQGTIQAARGELSKRKREALAKMEQMKQIYSEFSDEELDKIIGRYSKGPGAGSDFVEWLKSIKQEREDERSGVQQRQDVFRSVAGPMQGKQSQKAAPAQGKPWTQLGMTRDEFRKILNNPQHPRHREIKQLHDQYKQVDEDLTRRDFLKGVAGGAMALGAMKAAKALGLKDPTRSTDTDDQYQRFTGAKPAPLYAKPDLDPERKWNRVGVNQPGGQFSIVLHKDFDLYLYFVTRDFSTSPYAYIELQDGEKYKFRIRTLKNDTFTIEDPRMAATLLNYQGKFNLYVGDDVYTFNIMPSQESKVLYRWWKEGTHQGL